MAKVSARLAFLLFVCVFSFSFSPAAHAQNPNNYYEEVPRTFYGGLLLGMNAAQVDGDNYAGYKKFGINAGGIMYIRIAENLAGSVELLYSQKGARSDGAQKSGPAIIQKYKVTLDYAEIPLQINYFDKRRSHFGAGFSIGRFISAKESGEALYLPNPVDFEKYPFNKMDYNFIIGGNLHLYQGLFLNARFQYSLVPIRKGEDKVPPYFSGRREQFNNTWTVRLMYLF